jgi:NhaP-type Na+/H+ or K+/H+ antiporter
MLTDSVQGILGGILGGIPAGVLTAWLLVRWERKQATLARIAQRERLIGEFLAAAYGPAPLPFTREARHPLDAMPYDITKVN